MPRLLRPAVAVAITLTAAAVGAPPGAAAADPRPFGHACSARDGVRFCPTATDAERIPSFDGVPLDVDVTLPATGDGPFPTVVLIHGLGGSKTTHQLAGAKPRSRPRLQRYNNMAFAQRGYAVVQPSLRGFGRSCGARSSRTADCAKGYLRFADQRYEARDVQELLGRLADEGIVDPARIGVTGESYGGALSTTLAFLRDRIRLPDGRYTPWTSPRGRPLSIAAAAPVIGWTELSSALVPGGVPQSSFLVRLLRAARRSGFVAPEGADTAADFAGWKAALARDDPAGPRLGAILAELSAFHSPLGVTGGTPAPLQLSQGWSDDLFAPKQSLRVYDALRARDPAFPVTLDLGDFGHARASNRAVDLLARNTRLVAFLDARILGRGVPPPPGQVTATLDECRTRVAGSRVLAPAYEALHPGQVVVRGPRGSLGPIRSDGGDRALARAIEPGGGASRRPCDEVPFRTTPVRGTAQLLAPVRHRFTLLGDPVVTARNRLFGRSGQLVARLWDVDPRTRRQRLVSRGVSRVDAGAAEIEVRLNADGHRFRRGHRIRLELLGRDAPTYRPSPSAFTLRLSDVVLRLPVRERPSGSCGVVPADPPRRAE